MDDDPMRSSERVGEILDELLDSMVRQECRSCECLQGLLVRMEIDAGEEKTPQVKELEVPRSMLHSCLGCDPCPPAALLARYLNRKQS